MKCPKKYLPKPKVTRLIESTCNLPNGKSFTIVTDLPEKELDELGKIYLDVAKNPTAMGFIMAAKFMNPNCMCVTKEQYNEITDGKVEAATKEDYEKENN